jgi:hypothetical protein
MKACPLCGRKYVKAEHVVLPPTKDEVLSKWRADRRAAKAAAAAEKEAAAATAVTEAPAIPAAREHSEAMPDVLPQLETERSTTWTSTPIEVAPKLLLGGAAAMFTTAFALGEGALLVLHGF